MTNAGRITFLNGTSSVGKTSTARSLQQQLSDPYLHIALDAFLTMFPPRWVETSDGFGQALPSPGGDAGRAIHLGPVAQRLISGYHHALAACAVSGNNLIVDHVLLERQWLQECVVLLANFSVFFVGVHCPLEVLEARERERDDRAPGLARRQFERVHADAMYDLEIDTSLASPEECAAHIRRALRQPPTPGAFQQLGIALRGE
ncbi:MAG TPA: AAA family ATPase [Ktedonobacteraceae bacterium]|nr:AAA family ATPase [Ktedonobacteraceae bacterium]